MADTSSLNFSNNVSTYTGVPVSGGVDPSTSSSFTPLQSVTKNITTPISSRTSAQNLTTQNEVLPQNVTPYSTPDTPQTSTIPQDSYRYGNFSGEVDTDDNLNNPRTLGEQDDTIAALSLTAEVTGDILQNNLTGVSQQISQSLNNDASDFQPFSGSIISAYSRFFLQNVSEVTQEKVQVVETFTAFYVFFYGKKPPVYRYSGMLMNDENHKWTNDMQFFYENYFRGTKATELAAQAVMSYDGAIVSGFLIDLSVGKSAELDKGAPFSFSMIVTDHTPAYYSADISALIAAKSIQLANQAAVIAQQLAAINADVPTEASLLSKQVCTNNRAPTTASVTGAAITGNTAISNQSATTQQFNSALA